QHSHQARDRRAPPLRGEHSSRGRGEVDGRAGRSSAPQLASIRAEAWEAVGDLLRWLCGCAARAHDRKRGDTLALVGAGTRVLSAQALALRRRLREGIEGQWPSIASVEDGQRYL